MEKSEIAIRKTQLLEIVQSEKTLLGDESVAFFTKYIEKTKTIKSFTLATSSVNIAIKRAKKKAGNEDALNIVMNILEKALRNLIK